MSHPSDELRPDEAEVPRNIRVTLEALLNQGVDSREFAPAVKNRRTDEIIDGMHRLEADPTWPIIEVDLDSLWERIVRLILNWNRRGMDQPEMTKTLDFIAKETEWTPQEVSKNTGIPYRTVMRYISDEYKEFVQPSKKKTDSQELKTEQDRGLPSGNPLADAAITPHHEIPEVRVPDWLQKRFDQLDREREAATLEHEEIPKNLVEVALPVEEEEPELMTPEETLSEIYSELPVPPPTRFLQTALRRDHPDLTEEQIDEVIERTRPAEPDRLTRIYGVTCPSCGTWKPTSSMQRIVTELEKRDPELAVLIKERLTKQGWSG